MTKDFPCHRSTSLWITYWSQCRTQYECATLNRIGRFRISVLSTGRFLKLGIERMGDWTRESMIQTEWKVNGPLGLMGIFILLQVCWLTKIGFFSVCLSPPQRPLRSLFVQAKTWIKDLDWNKQALEYLGLTRYTPGMETRPNPDFPWHALWPDHNTVYDARSTRSIFFPFLSSIKSGKRATGGTKWCQ